eukprot:scaffold21642_cov63-Phaeocystis_antarctica.AAC.2
MSHDIARRPVATLMPNSACLRASCSGVSGPWSFHDSSLLIGSSARLNQTELFIDSYFASFCLCTIRTVRIRQVTNIDRWSSAAPSGSVIHCCTMALRGQDVPACHRDVSRGMRRTNNRFPAWL